MGWVVEMLFIGLVLFCVVCVVMVWGWCLVECDVLVFYCYGVYV